MNIDFIFNVILLIIFGSIGIMGNILLIRLFMNTDTKVNFHKLMITLAIYDLIYIIFSFVAFALPELSEDYIKYGFHHYIATKAVPLLQVTLTGSVYCTVSVSLERYMTVCHPFYVADKKWSAKWHIIPIIAFSIIYNAPHFFEFRTTYGPVKNANNTLKSNHSYTNIGFDNQTEDARMMRFNTTIISDFVPNLEILAQNATRNQSLKDFDKEENFEYQVELTELRKNKFYYTIYIIGLNLIFNGVIPFTTIVILNILLHNRLKEITAGSPYQSVSDSLTNNYRNVNEIKFNEIVLAKISIIISAVFLIFHSVKWIPNIYELIQRIQCDEDDIPWPNWIETITTISHFLIILNSSVNYYIYAFTHNKVPRPKRWNLNIINMDTIEMYT